MNRKIIIIVGSSVGFLVIVLSFWIIFSSSTRQRGINNEKIKIAEENKDINVEYDSDLEPSVEITGVTGTDNENSKEETIKKEDKEEIAEEKESINLEIMAIAFTERFGSYSNQSGYRNIKNLQPFMSKAMLTWSEKFIEDNVNSSEDYYNAYYGITTKAISKKVLDFDKKRGKMSILVKTLRRENTGTKSKARRFYQDIKVEIINEDGDWKVNGAHWKS